MGSPVAVYFLFFDQLFDQVFCHFLLLLLLLAPAACTAATHLLHICCQAAILLCCPPLFCYSAANLRPRCCPLLHFLTSCSRAFGRLLLPICGRAAARHCVFLTPRAASFWPPAQQFMAACCCQFTAALLPAAAFFGLLLT